jgi:4'-phosphopantetheinyl transferase
VLESGEVHVWRVPLHKRADLDGVLTRDERARGARFRFEHDRTRWMAARAWLRVTLARYLDIPPGEIAFSGGERDKPSLAPRFDAEWLRFNLAHSGEVALIAVSARAEVGVDIELVPAEGDDRHVRDDRELLDIARRVLDVDVVRALESSPPHARAASFYRAWVRHEARGKCDGAGIQEPGENRAVAHVVDIDVGPRYVGALAVERRPARVHLWDAA